jgi:hypothetical protein
MRRAVRGWLDGAGRGTRFGRQLIRTFLYLPTRLESMYFDNFGVFSRSLQEQLLTPQTKVRPSGLSQWS